VHARTHVEYRKGDLEEMRLARDACARASRLCVFSFI